MSKRKQNVISSHFDTEGENNQTKQYKKDKSISGDFDKKIVCEEWTHITGPQPNLSTLILYKKSDERRYIFNELEKQITYPSDPELTRIKVFGKWHDLPRKQAAYGSDGVTYKYSGLRVSALPWKQAPILQEILIRVKRATNIEYNFVLVNRYQDGKNKIGEHKDDEKELDPDVPIASLSLGQEREFILRHQDLLKKIAKDECVAVKERKYCKLLLSDGMLLLMKPPTNHFWYHSIPSRSVKKCPNVRINLTFRKIV